MTVSSSTRRVSYNGAGSTGPFAIPFYFLDNSHLLFTKRAADGTETVLTITTDYTVSGALNPAGGEAYTTVNLAIGERLVITGNVPLTQGLSLPETGLFSTKAAEQTLDKIVMITQQLQEQISRSILLNVTSSAIKPIFDDPIADRALLYSSDGLRIIPGPTANQITNAQGAATAALAAQAAAETARDAAQAAALNMKYRVARVATTANITLSGEQTIDGVACVSGERVLVKNQSSPSQNGIYVVASGAWSRASDMDTWPEVVGTVVIVTEGGTLADTAWLCTSNDGGTLGSTAINFVDWGQVVLAGSIALSKLATQAANTIVGNATGSSAAPTAIAISASRLFGRGSSGNIGEILLGSGLSMSGSTLNAASGHGQCQLTLSGGNLRLAPFNGNQLIINGVAQTVPSAAITLAPTGLTPSTLYYIYAYMNAGNMTLEASTTSYSTDATTGVNIKTGDATRTLVGIAYVVTGPAFADTAAQRFVRSWFNREAKAAVYNTPGTPTFTGASFAEVNSSHRASFICWANENVHTGHAVAARSSTANAIVFLATNIDNLLFPAPSTNQSSTASTTVSVSNVGNGFVTLSEGLHFVSLHGAVTAGTATVEYANSAGIFARLSGI